jgi:hypothetical protein
LRGEYGDAAGAAESLKELLADRVRVLGPDDPDTVGTRGMLASWRRKAAGTPDAAAALRDGKSG